MDIIAKSPLSRVLGPSSRESKARSKTIIIFMIRMLGFMLFSVFILCIPMGDPKDTCSVEMSKEEESLTTGMAYSYVCNVYRVMATTVQFTSDTMQEVSEYTGCFILNALHEAKLKIYGLVSTIDKQDLCRTVCCQDEGDLEEPTPQTKDKKSCKCKSKCCKRQQQSHQPK